MNHLGSPHHHRPPIDSGLQGERTALAWNRTALALFVNGLLAARAGWTTQQDTISWIAAVVIACSVLTFAYAGVRRRDMLEGGTPRVAAPASMAAIAGLTVLAAAVGCAAVVVSMLATPSP